MSLFEVDINSDFIFKNFETRSITKLAKLNNVNIENLELKNNEPIWRLFEIQLSQYHNKVFALNCYKNEKFKKNILLFKQLVDINSGKININYINFKIKELKKFFSFLIEIHFIFKFQEHYKLMWNLEVTFIRPTINILLQNMVTCTELEKLSSYNQIPYLY